MLLARNIFKTFGTTTVLRGVDIDLFPGRITVLIGPSGGGKTTLVRNLALLDVPTSGTISLDGTDYVFPTKAKRFPRPWPTVTVVFQEHFLWPHLTLRQNIELPVSGLPESQSRISDLIQRFHMSQFIDRYPNQASVGERQRAALARAFALRPKYILLDEITSALDVEQTAAVIQHLLALRSDGIGLLVVTHLLEFAHQLLARNEGDLVYFLDAGAMVAHGGVSFFARPPNARTTAFIRAIQNAVSIADGGSGQ